MLLNSKNILLKAMEEHRGLPAPDYFDLDSARCFVQVAEMVKRPLILSYAQVFEKTLSLEEAAMIGRWMGEKATIPVVLHFDHGLDEETIYRAIHLGFTSVMLDASMDSLEENIRRTREVVGFAHKMNVTVEAEVGHVGTGASYDDAEHCDSVYTTVNDAVFFVQQTKVDSLAVSVGTAHGVYKNKKPMLNFQRLRELRSAVSVPLVLHGSSGTGDENLSRCVHDGITKVNVFTEFCLSGMRAIEEEKPQDYFTLKSVINEGMKKALMHCFDVYGK